MQMQLGFWVVLVIVLAVAAGALVILWIVSGPRGQQPLRRSDVGPTERGDRTRE